MFENIKKQKISKYFFKLVQKKMKKVEPKKEEVIKLSKMLLSLKEGEARIYVVREFDEFNSKFKDEEKETNASYMQYIMIAMYDYHGYELMKISSLPYQQILEDWGLNPEKDCFQEYKVIYPFIPEEIYEEY